MATTSEDAAPADRSTFLKVGTILARTRSFARRAQQGLLRDMRAKQIDERTRIFLDWVEEERSELDAALQRGIEAAPEQVLDTHVQYGMDSWDGELERPKVASIAEITRWLIELDERIVRTYREIAAGQGSDDVRELLTSLVDLVQSHDRRLSRESQDASDL